MILFAFFNALSKYSKFKLTMAVPIPHFLLHFIHYLRWKSINLPVSTKFSEQIGKGAMCLTFRIKFKHAVVSLSQCHRFMAFEVFRFQAVSVV